MRDLVRGTTLYIPIGDTVDEVRVGAQAVEITRSLRTTNKAEAIARNAAALSYLENVYSSHRCAKPVSLSRKQCSALAGEWYRSWASDATAKVLESSDPEAAPWGYSEATLASLVEKEPERIEKGETQKEIAWRVDAFLRGKGLRVDEPTREVLLDLCASARFDALKNQLRNAQGDYSTDPVAARFPDYEPPQAIAKAAPKVECSRSLTPLKLLERWRAHPEQEHIAQSTVASYASAFRKLEAFLKAENRKRSLGCETITPDDVKRFVEHRLQSVRPKTVRGIDLPALREVFAWGKSKGLVSSNPAKDADVRIKVRKTPGARVEKTLNESEAIAILRHALHYVPTDKREGPKTTAAKRWVPWLNAYTGTRVGEMAQLRKEDVVEYRNRWAVRVSYMAGTTKTKHDWFIPLHPHLIELGFLEFVKGSKPGHLFFTPRPENYNPAKSLLSRTSDERGILGPLKACTNRVREFVREVLPRRGAVAPNHGWRHRFKAKGRECRIDPVVLNAFADHAGRTEGEKYGSDALFDAMAAAVEKLPSYEIE